MELDTFRIFFHVGHGGIAAAVGMTEILTDRDLTNPIPATEEKEQAPRNCASNREKTSFGTQRCRELSLRTPSLRNLTPKVALPPLLADLPLLFVPHVPTYIHTN